ncbi:MAG: hypothetical protein HQM02_06230 [Magnetococcales bacterium]|nr:hypothetical protein [Magnetococcales bacterium]
MTLAHRRDRPSWNVHQAFVRRHGADSGRFVTVESLVGAPHWSHQLGGEEKMRVRTRIRFTDGLEWTLNSDTLVFNRLRRVTVEDGLLSSPADREFAAMEWQALLRSLLESLPCRVINPAVRQGMSGVDFSDAQWMLLARRAELPVRGLSLFTNPRHLQRRGRGGYCTPRLVDGRVRVMEVASGRGAALPALGRGAGCFLEETARPEARSVLVAGNAVVGEIPASLEIGCIKLARLVECELLQLWFAPGARRSDWRFLAASTFPECTREDHVEAVVGYLGGQAGL